MLVHWLFSAIGDDLVIGITVDNRLHLCFIRGALAAEANP